MKAVKIKPKKGTSKKKRDIFKALEYKVNSPKFQEKIKKAYMDSVLYGTGELHITEDEI